MKRNYCLPNCNVFFLNSEKCFKWKFFKKCFFFFTVSENVATFVKKCNKTTESTLPTTGIDNCSIKRRLEVIRLNKLQKKKTKKKQYPKRTLSATEFAKFGSSLKHNLIRNRVDFVIYYLSYFDKSFIFFYLTFTRTRHEKNGRLLSMTSVTLPRSECVKILHLRRR